MNRKFFLTTLATTALLLGVTNWAMADGKPHEGGHSDAFAADCLKPIQQTGLLGVGSWENTCSYGVHVRWRIVSDERGTGCTSKPGRYYPCLWYVGPNSRTTATMSDDSGGGAVEWIACRSTGIFSGKDIYSSPWPVWPVITKIKSDGNVKYKCFHIGYGPEKNGGASPRALERALRQNHGQIISSLQQYDQQEVARIEREQERARQEREREEYLAAQERLRWEEEQFEWEQEQRQRELENARKRAEMWNQVGKSLGELIFSPRGSNVPSVSAGSGQTRKCRDPELACGRRDGCPNWRRLPLCR